MLNLEGALEDFGVTPQTEKGGLAQSLLLSYLRSEDILSNDTKKCCKQLYSVMLQIVCMIMNSV